MFWINFYWLFTWTQSVQITSYLSFVHSANDTKKPKGSWVKSTTCTCQPANHSMLHSVLLGNHDTKILRAVKSRALHALANEMWDREYCPLSLKTEKESKSNSLPHDIIKWWRVDLDVMSHVGSSIVTSLIYKSANWSPSYNKTARTFPYIFFTPSFNEQADSKRTNTYQVERWSSWRDCDRELLNERKEIDLPMTPTVPMMM